MDNQAPAPQPVPLPPYEWPTVLDVHVYADLALKVAHELYPCGLFALPTEHQEEVWKRTTVLMHQARCRLETKAFLEGYLAAAPPELPSVKTPPGPPPPAEDPVTARVSAQVRESLRGIPANPGGYL